MPPSSPTNTGPSSAYPIPAARVKFSVIVPVIVQASTVPVSFEIVSSVVPAGQLSFGTRSISAAAVPPPGVEGLTTTGAALPGEVVLPPPQAASEIPATVASKKLRND